MPLATVTNSIASKRRFRALVININRADPTCTLVLRRQFSAQMTNRFRTLKGQINRKIIDEDFLGASENIGVLTNAEWEYRWADRKVGTFMGWLKEQQDAGVLEVIQRPGLAVGTEPWTNTYVQSAYQKGIIQGRANLRSEGAEIPTFATLPGVSEMSVAFNQPFHADRVALIYTRVFEELKGVTAAMDQQISRVLARGMAEGRGPREIARHINDRVDKIGLTRARLIARTEIVHTHNIATLNEYEAAENVIGEKVKVQWFTARDDRVRPHHITRHEKVYDRDVARTLIGEPNCRCALLPWIPSVHEGEVKPTKPKFIPAKNVNELNSKFQKIGIDNLNFTGYSDSETLKIGNLLGKHIHGVFEKNPTVKNLFKKGQNLSNFRISKGRVLIDIPEFPVQKLAGQYNFNSSSIKIAGSLHKVNKLSLGSFNISSDFFGASRHELGHHVFDKFLNKKVKDRWGLFFTNNKDVFRGKVSKYAASDAIEAFSETFATYTSPLYGSEAKYILPKEIENLIKETLNVI